MMHPDAMTVGDLIDELLSVFPLMFGCLPSMSWERRCISTGRAMVAGVVVGGQFLGEVVMSVPALPFRPDLEGEVYPFQFLEV